MKRGSVFFCCKGKIKKKSKLNQNDTHTKRDINTRYHQSNGHLMVVFEKERDRYAIQRRYKKTLNSLNQKYTVEQTKKP